MLYLNLSSDQQITSTQFKLAAVGSYGAVSYKGIVKTINFTIDGQVMTIQIPELTLTSDTDTPPQSVQLSASIFIPK